MAKPVRMLMAKPVRILIPIGLALAALLVGLLALKPGTPRNPGAAATGIGGAQQATAGDTTPGETAPTANGTNSKAAVPTAGGDATTGSGTTPERQGFTIDPPTPASDFLLTDQHGRPFRLSEQRGRAVVLFFGYTHCPDVCPATLVTFKAVKEQLAEAAGRVRFVFITVDPERDTPERLREYVSYYDPSFIGLWGTPDQLKAVQAAYGVVSQKDPQPDAPGGYWVLHTAVTMLVDPQGNLRAIYPFGASASQIAADVKRLVGS